MRLQGIVYRFAAADDVLQPGALLLLGIRNVVIQLLLQLEGFTHVVPGGRQVLGEGGDGILAVRGHGKGQFLLT